MTGLVDAADAEPAVLGPEWSQDGLGLEGAQRPLAVERHVLALVAKLVPGVTTVTAHARYYALHALVAAEAVDRQLTASQAQDLLRRCEVAIAAVSLCHVHTFSDFPRVHAAAAVSRLLDAGDVYLAEAAGLGKGSYSPRRWGYWNDYAGQEAALGIVVADAGRPAVGSGCDVAAVRGGLGELLTLARRDVLRRHDLEPLGDQLCVCRGGRNRDGRWLAQLLCNPADDGPDGANSTRWQTIRLLARLVMTHEVRSIERDLWDVIAFAPDLEEDAALSKLDVTQVWRGLVLRAYSVGAWRRLWSWLVGQIPGGRIGIDDWADTLAGELPSGTVNQFMGSLPPTSAGGRIASAEAAVWKDKNPGPTREFAILALGAKRASELTGSCGQAFHGPAHESGRELYPAWLARRLDEQGNRALADFARDLVTVLLRRSQRVAFEKARRGVDGTVKVPTRVVERDGFVFKNSEESASDVTLRLNSLTNVLAGCGVLIKQDGLWRVDREWQALGV